MTDVLTVRLGKKRAAALNAFCAKTGVKKAEVVRNGIDQRIGSFRAGLPPVAARWAGKVPGPGIEATNARIRSKFRR